MKFLSILALVSFVSCAPQTKVSWETAEDARRQVRENVTAVAQDYRSANKLAQYDLMIRGDSTISLECPMGDGWASVDLVDREKNHTLELKCSTVSAGLGCLPSSEFKSKVYAKEEGRCNTEIPFPLPKIAK